MASRELVVEHDLDMPPSIVWDALVDEELVNGWLGSATIDAVTGGGYRVAWVGRPGYAGIDGRIDTYLAPQRLRIVTRPSGSIEFALEPRSGGLRGTWTRLRLTVVSDGLERSTSGSDDWNTALAQLDELLRGHPVHWRESRHTSSPARDTDSA